MNLRRARRLSHLALISADAFAAITAIGGGIALAAGLERDRFPATWLTGTPFRSYVGPGLLLAGVVGGGAAAATVASIRSPRASGPASVLAGAVLASWILGEVVLLAKDEAVISPTEALYLGVAIAMTGLGLRATRARRLLTDRASAR
jgi:hypothetical protein